MVNSLPYFVVAGAGAAPGAAACGWCRSNAGRSERMRGSEAKLWRGGGQEVTHSSEQPYSHGSSTSTLVAFRWVTHIFQKKISVDAPSTNELTEERMFSAVNPSAGR